MKWRITYRYVNPHGAGPFTGSAVIERPDKPQRGEIIPAMFGQAQIKTVSRVKEFELDPKPEAPALTLKMPAVLPATQRVLFPGADCLPGQKDLFE